MKLHRSINIFISSVFILSVSLYSCKKDDDSAEDVQPLKVVFHDSFENNNNQWYVGSDSLFQAEIHSGSYLLNLQKDSFYYWVATPVEYNTGNTFLISGSFRGLSLTTNSLYGLYWGASGSSEANYFLLDRHGNCLIGFFNNFKAHTLLPLYNSGYVDTAATNTLTVERDGNLVKYLINGKLVFDENYRVLGTRNVGFFIENKTSVAIDELQVLD